MKIRRFSSLFALSLMTVLMWGQITLWQPTKVFAAPLLQVFPLGWNVIGLDSNNPNVGPNNYLNGARVCNIGSDPATNVTATFNLGSGNSNITVLSYATGNPATTSTLSIPSLPAGSSAVPPGNTGATPNNCFDFYFQTQIARTNAAYSTLSAPSISGRAFRVDVTADGVGTISTPINRELYVEKLLSQGRNTVNSISGPTTVFVGDTVQYTVTGKTAPGGYEQLEFVPNLPNFFQLLSVSTTYSTPGGATNNSIYGDACGWENDYTNTTYYHNNLTCNNPAIPNGYSGGKVGDTITTVYRIKILGTGTGQLTNTIYDFSGSSYHYNSDVGSGVNALSITAVNVPDLTITKTHSGNFSQRGTGTYTITVRNSGMAATSGTVTVSDTLPAGLTPIAATSPVGSGWSCTISGQTVTCTRSTSVAASTNSTITLTVAIAANAPASLTNIATVAGGGEVNTSNNSASDPTAIDPVTVGSNFACDGIFYQIRVPSGTQSQLFRIDRSTATYTQIQVGNITGTGTLNAMGYNKNDGFFYLLKAGTNLLYRIGQQNAEFVGIVSGLPTTYNGNTGTMDLNNNLYVSQDNEVNRIYRINVNTLTATAITLTSSSTLTAGQFVGDIAFHPTNGFIYGVRNASLYRIDPSNGTVVLIGNNTTGGTFGSTFFDPAGRFYGYDNAGRFYLFDINTGAATLVSGALASTSSDGANCPFTSPERRLATTKTVGTVSPVNNRTFDVPYTIVVTNTGTDTAPNAQVTENLALTFATGSPTIAIQSAPQVTAGNCTVNNNFNGTSDFQLLTGSNTLTVGGSCTIALTVRVTYANASAVPTAAQNNTIFASSTLNAPNTGYEFSNNVSIPPINLLSSAQATATVTFSASQPELLLAKRITAIGNRTQNPNDGTLLNTFVDDPRPDDNDVNWPSPNTTYLRGALDGGRVKPNDEIEYAIYFLNTLKASLNVSICDLVPDNQTFVPTGYNNAVPRSTEPGVAASSDTGIALGLNATTLPSEPTLYLTNANDGDRGRYLPPGDPQTPAFCRKYDKNDNLIASGVAANTNGAIVVNVVRGSDLLPPATGAGTPSNSYGFIRFRARVR